MRFFGAFACAVALWAAPAFAYRPFDQTDADVAPTHEFELELGPLQAQAAQAYAALTPTLVLNFGIAPGFELVFDGASQVNLTEVTKNTPRWGFDSALLLKSVLRRGCLQGGWGPSVATEGGIIMPQLPTPSLVGAQLALIVSQRWSFGTVHVNVLGERNLLSRWEVLAGAIVEGPAEWKIRPVAEAYADTLVNGTTVASILVGGIWELSEDLALDGALRVVTERSPVFELRLGFTWSISDRPE